MLIEAGVPYQSIQKRTGHRGPDSLRNYQNLRGKSGKIQQDAILDKETLTMSRKDDNEIMHISKRQKPLFGK